MFPGGMNPKQMKKMMKRMGVSMQDIDALEVVIKTPDKDIVIAEPQVVKTQVQGQDMWQVTGKATETETKASVEIADDDVAMVSAQAGVSEGEARKALESSGGDLAQAIIELKS